MWRLICEWHSKKLLSFYLCCKRDGCQLLTKHVFYTPNVGYLLRRLPRNSVFCELTIMIEASSWENLSSVSNQVMLKQWASETTYNIEISLIASLDIILSSTQVNNKGADKTVWMCRLVCAFVVHKTQRQVFSCWGPYDLSLNCFLMPLCHVGNIQTFRLFTRLK